MLPRRAEAEADRAANGAPPITQRGDDEVAARRGRFCSAAVLAQRLQQSRGADTGEFAVHRCEEHAAVAVENENRRYGDPAFFFTIDYSPLLDHLAARVAKYGKRQIVPQADSLGAGRFVDGKRGEVEACVAETCRVVAILRQLAKTHRSPVSSIENQNARALGHELRESARRAGRIGKRKFRSDLAGLGSVAFGHAY